MLARFLSMRRGAHMEEEDKLDEHSQDDSKTRKHLSIATRITSYFTRTDYLCPVTIAAIIILIITSYFLQSRDLLCVSSVSSFDRLSRSWFFCLDGIDSDFGALGVPWCKISSLFDVIDVIV
ncbi:hypothetical protein HanXRQr2_Chr10g0457031 [Helianthus annuus]|uniref:Uncharacterized protein n=1 Tax=Helianthus annuus TaxID=4232 RepID=A0A251TRB0_HELAN|nr:hypothetical protein HanXRQr2_Chr10g0457031 [Helianthus annuus]